MNKKKKSKRLKFCRFDGCLNKPAPGRTQCYKCRSRGIAERKPIDMCFYFLRKSAKKRDLEFTIELPWFKEWISKTGYMGGKGRLSQSLNIDRIDNLLGYTKDNVQILTKHDNVSKYFNSDEHRLLINSQLGDQFEGEVPF